MSSVLERPLRFLLRRVKALLKSNRIVRNLLSDMDNTDEFGDLYEHEFMIADTVRVNTYRDRIKLHLRRDDVVVDLGTGTGILSLFAARNQPKHIYALDHSPFIEIAKRIADHNKIENVTFVNTNSRSFAPAEPVDLILHEQIGDDLFDENMVENVLDLKKRLLKRSGRILPGKFELYLEPVCLKPEYKVAYIWEQQVNGVDFRFLKGSADLDRYKRRDYPSRHLRWGSIDHFLCEPTPIMSFDLNTMSHPDEITRPFAISRTVVNPGLLDGLCLYFRVIFDEQISFDTSPMHTATHWANRLFRFESRPCKTGDVFSCRLEMRNPVDVYTWSVSVR